MSREITCCPQAKLLPWVHTFECCHQLRPGLAEPVSFLAVFIPLQKHREVLGIATVTFEGTVTWAILLGRVRDRYGACL